MRALFGLFVTGVVCMFGACGGTSSPLLDSSDGGGSSSDGGGKRDASRDGGDGGACVHPVAGESCTTSESVCGQVGQGNPCCDQAWRCIDGKWQSFAAECACEESVTCGDKTCTAGQYCQVQPPGIALEDGGIPPTSYTCMNVPAACAGNDTCACLESSPPCLIDTCTDSNGEVPTLPTVNCIGE